MTLSAFLFDLDGTLVDSDALHFEAFLAISAPLGVRFDREFFDRHISGQTNAQICRTLFPDLPLAQHERIADEKEAMFRGMLSGADIAIPGVVSFIDRAAAAGIRLGVVSNAPGANVTEVLAALGLSDRFEVVISGGMAPRGKPDPAPYQAALERLGVPAAKTIAFEDTALGLRAAVGAGIVSVGVATSHADEALLGAGAALAIRDFEDHRLAAFIAKRFGLSLV